jgi:hypothetical protein
MHDRKDMNEQEFWSTHDDAYDELTRRDISQVARLDALLLAAGTGKALASKRALSPVTTVVVFDSEHGYTVRDVTPEDL